MKKLAQVLGILALFGLIGNVAAINASRTYTYMTDFNWSCDNGVSCGEARLYGSIKMDVPSPYTDPDWNITTDFELFRCSGDQEDFLDLVYSGVAFVKPANHNMYLEYFPDCLSEGCYNESTADAAQGNSLSANLAASGTSEYVHYAGKNPWIFKLYGFNESSPILFFIEGSGGSSQYMGRSGSAVVEFAGSANQFWITSDSNLHETYASCNATATTTTTTSTTTTLQAPENSCDMYVTVYYENASLASNGAATVYIAPPGDALSGSTEETDANGIAAFENISCTNYNVGADDYPDYSLQTYLLGVYGDGNYTVTMQGAYQPSSLNVEFWVSEYGSLTMTNNRVELYACDTESQCLDHLQPDFFGGCDLLTYTDDYTNATGYKSFAGIETDKPILCGQTKYYDINNNINKRKAHIIQQSDTDVDFNFTYAMTDQTYDICVDFYDSVTDTDLDDYSLTISQDNNVYLATTTASDSNCFVTSSISDLSYKVFATKTNYEEFDYWVTLGLVTSYFYMDPIESNVTGVYRFNVSGYVLDADGNALPNIRVKSSCSDIQQYTNSSGQYAFHDIIKGSSCSFETSDFGYINDKRITNVNANIYGFNLSITAKTSDDNTFDVNIHVLKDSIFIGEYDDVDGASVSAKASGYPMITCITRLTGRCDLMDMIYDRLYDITIQKSGYQDYKETIRMTGDEYSFVISEVGDRACGISGYVKLLNGSVEVPVQGAKVIVEEENGPVLLSVLSNSQGFYEALVECGRTYKVTAEYDLLDKTARDTETVKIPLVEGSSATANFILSSDVSDWRTKINNFKDFVELLIFPLLYIIGIFGFMIVLREAEKKLNK